MCVLSWRVDGTKLNMCVFYTVLMRLNTICVYCHAVFMRLNSTRVCCHVVSVRLAHMCVCVGILCWVPTLLNDFLTKLCICLLVCCLSVWLVSSYACSSAFRFYSFFFKEKKGGGGGGEGDGEGGKSNLCFCL